MSDSLTPGHHDPDNLADRDRVIAERNCLAMAVLFAVQWTPDAPMGLREGIEEILATMPQPPDGYEQTTGHLVTCLAVAGGAPDPACGCAADTVEEPETLPLLFWDKEGGVVYSDGRIDIPVRRAVNLAQAVPAGRMVLQLATARALRQALTTALADADEATAEHHTVDGTRYLCHADDHYCPDGPGRVADEEQPADETPGSALKRAHVALAEQAGRDRAALNRVREQAEQWAALAPSDDWGDGPQDALKADIGRFLLRLVDGQQPATETQDASFVTRVLEIFSMSHADAYDDLLWRVDNSTVHLSASVSDVFAWGSADCEPITPDTLPALEQAYADLKALGAEGFTAELYAARQRGERPQGAAYPDDRDPSWREVSALYDACGPEREIGLGNPKAAPAHAPAAEAVEPAAADIGKEPGELPCNAAKMIQLGSSLAAHHGPHLWEVMSGMDPVRCPGTEERA